MESGSQSAQQQKTAAMSFDERKTFAATREDLEQNTADVLVVTQRQVLVIQKHRERWMSHCFSTLTRPSTSQLRRRRRASTIKAPRKTARGLHDEVRRNQDGQEAAFCPVQDRELSSTVKVRATCVSEYAASREAALDEAHVCSVEALRAIPQERVEQRTVARSIDVPVPGACPRANRRTDHRCASATADFGRGPLQ